MTPKVYIYAPDANYQVDYSITSVVFKEHFVHEMSHVLQCNEGVSVRAAGFGIWLSGGYINQRAYNIPPGLRYRDANIEQQGEVCVDQYE